MTNQQITALLAGGYALRDVRLRPDLNLSKTDLPDARTDFEMRSRPDLDLWEIEGLCHVTHVAAADVMSLRLSNLDRAKQAA